MTNESPTPFDRFISIIEQLRDPTTGCPWDKEQTHESLKRYLIEEAYEVLDAIDMSPGALCEELGDLMLQVGLHSQIAAEAGHFSIDDVLTSIVDKLIERHPHVFGGTSVTTAAEVATQWDAIKQRNKKSGEGILAGIPRHLPALIRGQKISKRAAAKGFEWEELSGIRDKILEEVAEFSAEAVKPEKNPTALQDEFGDILFSLIQLARRHGFDAEEALQRTNNRFIARFERIESQSSKKLEELSPEEWRGLWNEAKSFVKHGDSEG